jgi:predicted PurR-regulated permease PerM
MTAKQNEKGYLNRAVEVSMHVGLVILLVVACFLILRPFILAITWGIVVAIAVYPGYRKLKGLLGGRGRLTAVFCTIILLAMLILPVTLMAGTMVKGIQTLSLRLKEGTLIVPPPPPAVVTWPIVGTSLNHAWSLASTNLTDLLSTFAPQIKAFMPKLLSASAWIASTVLQFVLSIFVSGILLAKAEHEAELTRVLANRLFGDRGPEFHKLITATIRSVTVGILGVAFVQSVFAGLGFLVGGLPGAGLWTLIFLVAAVLQMGIVVLIPAVIYAFTITTTTKAAIFLIWCAIVGLMDNLLKPLLLGRGLGVPIAVVFLGAIGGFIAMGIIGLFVGAVVMSVGYQLFLTWMRTDAV